MLANDIRVVLVYIASVPRDANWDGTSTKVVDHNTRKEKLAIVVFDRVQAHYFGNPNDEAVNGHPLHARGLNPCDTSEVSPSGWIADLERMNSVHAYHDPKVFAESHHYVFAFHDTLFEIVCTSFSVNVVQGSVSSASRMALDSLEG